MHYRKRTAVAVLVSIAFASTVLTGGAAATGSLGGSDRTIGADEQARLHVALSDAPAGLQRYNVTVHLGNDDVAAIESVAAGDVGAFQVHSQSADAVTFRAADLSRDVQAGATNVSLGVLTVSGADPGSSEVGYIVHDFRTDDGEQVSPAIRRGTLTVRSTDAGATTTASNDSGSPDRALAVLVSGSLLAWAGGGSVIVLAVLAALYRWRNEGPTSGETR